MRLGSTEKLIIYILSRKDGVPTKDLVDLLAKIKRSESAVRATLFRLRAKGLISGSKSGRETLYVLADPGREVLSSIQLRLRKAETKWGGEWLLLSFNVPERKRVVRTVLRGRLKSLGFGRLHANLWISPYDLRKECREIVRELRAEDYVVMFVVSRADEDPRALAWRVWDIEKLAKRYRRVLPQYAKKLAEFREKGFGDPEEVGMEALVRILELKNELSEFAEEDPMLPAELLPEDWAGIELRGMVVEYLQLLYQRASSVVGYEYLTGGGR